MFMAITRQVLHSKKERKERQADSNNSGRGGPFPLDSKPPHKRHKCC